MGYLKNLYSIKLENLKEMGEFPESSSHQIQPRKISVTSTHQKQQQRPKRKSSA